MLDPVQEVVTTLRVVSSEAEDAPGDIEVRSTLSIGRSDDCDVVIHDKSMSRVHAYLEPREDGRLFIRDNGSSNGVVVQGERVQEAELEVGQHVALGTTILEVLPLPTEEDGDVVSFPEMEIDPDRTVAISDVGALLAQAEAEKAQRAAKAVKPLEEVGEPMVTLANRPMLLFDANSMYSIESGKVEIFTVDVEEGKPKGARTHFLSVDEGEAFFGLDTRSAGYDSGFLAVGKAGSQLRRYEVDRLQMLATVPAYRERIAGMVATWVQGLSRRLIADVPNAPVVDVSIRAGDDVELPPEKPVAAQGDVLWLEIPGGARLLFDSMASLSYEVEGLYFPLAPGSWIEHIGGDEPLDLNVATTEEVIEDPRAWAGLEAFHRVLFECEFLNKKLAMVDEFNRLQRKAEQDEVAREAGIGAIESVLAGTQSFDLRKLGLSDLGPVYEAARLVGEASGIEVQRPIDVAPDLTYDDMLQAVAVASRFRTRKVALTDDWWNLEQGPLLGQRDDNKTPVALIPTGTSSYDYIEPLSGRREKLTEELADELVPFADSFYRPFPDGRITARDLIRFGTWGMQREFRETAAMGVAIGLLSTVTPAITGLVFDSAIPNADRGLLLQMCMALGLVALATSSFKIVQNIATLRVQQKMEYGLQSGVWDRLLDLPMNFFRQFSSGDLADRAQAVDRIRDIIAGAGVAAVLGSLASMFNVVQMALYSVQLAAVGFAMTALYVGITVLMNYLQLRMQREELAKRGGLTGLVLQLITGVGKIRVSGAENHAFKTWATDFSSMRRVAFSVGRIQNVMSVVNSGFPVFSSMAIFYMMYYLQQSALEAGEQFSLTTGDFLAFNAAYGIFNAAMQALGDASLSVLRIVPVYERLQPILEEEPEIDSSKAPPPRLRGAIQISHVSFRYTPEGPLILRDVSLEIEPGEFVAFVGGSGSGKSTLMRVMLGFEQPETGSVYYDGQDLSTLDVRLVRGQLGVVLQQSRLLPADIYRNIVGTSSATLQEAWDAARKAGLADDIKNMPMGMHTYVSEGGGGFSGGQKQRLMIARALVHNPRILYLDEATSALDNRTQEIVTESMDRLNATRVVIAHRLSTIRNADKICYLDQGVIAEMGSYEELMEEDGLFAELARRQLS